MDNAQIIRDAVREKAQIITGLNRSVWEYAELGYQETKSAATIIKALEDDGFTVTKELAGIPTAFKAVWGSGSPVVGILGEYDALPGLSQKAGVAAPEPDEGHTTGHGCGHCALGAGAVGGMLIGMICQIFIVPALFVVFQIIQEKIKPLKWNDQVISEIEQYSK